MNVPVDEVRIRLSEVLGDKTAFLKSAKKSFEQFDEERAGRLRQNDIHRLVNRLCENLQLPPIDDESLAKIFTKYDTESHGYLTRDEFLQFYWRMLWQVRKKYFPQKEVQISREQFVRRFTLKKEGGITELFDFRDRVGAGSFGEVYRVVEWQSQLVRTCKIIDKSLASVPMEQIEAEIAALKTLDHPNIIKIFDVYEDDKKVFIIMEYCEGGELLERILEAQNRRKAMGERFVCVLMRQIFKALAYFHNQKVLHKDLKPENILFQNRDPLSPIKVIDFGLAEIFRKTELSHNAAGTVLYMSPEVFQRRLSFKCDVWSAGVIMYLMLTSHLPFAGKTVSEIKYKVHHEEPNYAAHCPHVSPLALDLLKKTLHKNLALRPSATEALSHPWFQINLLDPAVSPAAPPSPMLPSEAAAVCLDNERMLAPPGGAAGGGGGGVLEIPASVFINLQRFVRQGEIKLALINMIAHQLDFTNPQVAQISNLFCALDSDANGTLSPDEIRAGIATDVPPWEVNKIIQAMDIDGDGQVSFTEFLAAAYAWRQSDIHLVWSAFQKLAENGRVSVARLTDMLLGDVSTDDERRKNLLISVRTIDINNDDYVDWEEFLDYISRKPQ